MIYLKLVQYRITVWLIELYFKFKISLSIGDVLDILPLIIRLINYL